jgi:DMSO reductase anchor subunit
VGVVVCILLWVCGCHLCCIATCSWRLNCVEPLNMNVDVVLIGTFDETFCFYYHSMLVIQPFGGKQ